MTDFEQILEDLNELNSSIPRLPLPPSSLAPFSQYALSQAPTLDTASILNGLAFDPHEDSTRPVVQCILDLCESLAYWKSSVSQVISPLVAKVRGGLFKYHMKQNKLERQAARSAVKPTPQPSLDDSSENDLIIIADPSNPSFTRPTESSSSRSRPARQQVTPHNKLSDDDLMGEAEDEVEVWSVEETEFAVLCEAEHLTPVAKLIRAGDPRLGRRIETESRYLWFHEGCATRVATLPSSFASSPASLMSLLGFGALSPTLQDIVRSAFFPPSLFASINDSGGKKKRALPQKSITVSRSINTRSRAKSCVVDSNLKPDSHDESEPLASDEDDIRFPRPSSNASGSRQRSSASQCHSQRLSDDAFVVSNHSDPDHDMDDSDFEDDNSIGQQQQEPLESTKRLRGRQQARSVADEENEVEEEEGEEVQQVKKRRRVVPDTDEEQDD